VATRTSSRGGPRYGSRSIGVWDRARRNRSDTGEAFALIIPTVFFEPGGVWYYEQPLPEGRKNYTKTVPLQFEEFAECQAWWSRREENDRAWRVPVADLLVNNCNLDRKNPRAAADITHLPPEELVASILAKEQRIAEIMGNIRDLLAKQSA